MNLKTTDWYTLNKCNRMVDTYIADMDKFLSYSEWPDKCMPEPLYLKTLVKYLDRVCKKIKLTKNRNHMQMITVEYIYKVTNAKQEYLISIINKFKRFNKDIGIDNEI